jgi:glycosyltransferase involved in cell wall biosynthesis
MKLSYAITVCNEFEETINLITTLLNYKGENSEIVVLLDTPKAPNELIEYLELQAESNHIDLIESEFDNNFANWKNFLNLHCKGDWIFQIDADELLDANLIVNLEEILETNMDKDLILVPRINIVQGITNEHIEKWGWNMNEDGWINFPDVQTRLYKKSDKIQWVGEVHERIVGCESYSNFPMDEVYCLKHIKSIEKQENAVKLYQTINPEVKEKL